MASKRRASPLAVLGARYPDLETRDFLARVCDSVVRVASPYRADNREIRDTIRERVRVRPSAFRITKGPHPEALDVDDGVRVVYAFVITPDGLPTQDEVSRYAALWWELDSTETHELALVVVDSDGHGNADGHAEACHRTRRGALRPPIRGGVARGDRGPLTHGVSDRPRARRPRGAVFTNLPPTREDR